MEETLSKICKITEDGCNNNFCIGEIFRTIKMKTGIVFTKSDGIESGGAIYLITKKQKVIKNVLISQIIGHIKYVKENGKTYIYIYDSNCIGDSRLVGEECDKYIKSYVLENQR